MSCNTDWQKEYPESFFALFVSDPTTSNPMSDSDMSDAHNGALAHFRNSGQANNSDPGTKEITADPYSTRMRPVSNLQPIIQNRAAVLVKLEVFAIDVTLDNSPTGQEQTVLDAIYDSRPGSANVTYAQSYFKNSLVNFWQPNFCRPEFWVNGKNALNGLQSTNFGDHKNKGDHSIGVPVPYCFEIGMEFKEIDTINAYGQMVQIVDVSGTDWYQRYALFMMASFRRKYG